MAINPKVINNNELGEIDLAYVDIWEHSIDFMLTVIRDWKNEEEFYRKLDAKWVEADPKEGEEETIHGAVLNEIRVLLSDVKSFYKDDADSKIFLAIDRFVELRDESQIFWNPLFAPELIRRYKKAGWKNVEYRLAGIPDSKNSELCTAHFFLVFTLPDEADEAQNENIQPIRPVVHHRPVNQRAGWVYLLKAENGLYKIGRSKSPKIRVSAITRAVAPFEITEVHKAFYTDCVKAEGYFHLTFKEKAAKGEWFALTADDIKFIIEYQHTPL